jgi:hypothetical protein
LTPWKPQSVFARVNNQTLNHILDVIAAGIIGDDGKPTGDLFTATRFGKLNKRWAGNIILELVKSTPKEAQQVLDQWLSEKVLEEIEVETTTSRGVKRKGLTVNDQMRPGTLISEDTL